MPEAVLVDTTFVTKPLLHEERTSVSNVFVHRRHEKGRAPTWSCSKDSTKVKLCTHVARVKAFLKLDPQTKKVFADLDNENVVGGPVSGMPSSPSVGHDLI